jgi:predicted glycosyltransferase
MYPRTNARVALYSHDSTGLGHVRRNLLIAGELGRAGHDVLLVSGSPEATSMARPPGTDLVTLPALRKTTAGRYEARHLRMAFDELVAMRRGLLTSALASFGPDLLIVDRHARGFAGELEPALERATGTRTVLGLRDVLDAPERVREEWQVEGTAAALDRWYDEVWVYGDRRLHDPIAAAGVEVPVPVQATGYLVADRTPAPVDECPETARGPFVLCMVGGGSDGEHVARAVLDASLPGGLGLIVVTGPQMAAAARRRLTDRAAGRDEVTVVDYLRDPALLLRRARAAIVMGGYNTVCEVLSSETPTLIVPRERPRLEQTIRAQALSAAGLLDVTAAEEADGTRVGDWLTTVVHAPRRRRSGVDRDGLHRLASRSVALLPDAGRLAPTPPGERSPATHASGPGRPSVQLVTDDHRGDARAAV